MRIESQAIRNLVIWVSLTMFLQDDNFSSRAPTFRSKSPTMFKAESLAEGVNCGVNLPPADDIGEDLVEDGGVSCCHDSRDSTSSASLFESENNRGGFTSHHPWDHLNPAGF